MKKMKLILNESLISNKDVDVLEDVSVQRKPDYQIIDVTVIPDENYYPTIQSILINLDENNKLKESDNSKLDINILSETVNQKTGYSNSLFEFESSSHTITLSLTLQETERRGVYKVEAYTTKGIKVFESNTYKPRMVIESYLNSLANEYLIDKPLKEAEEDYMQELTEPIDEPVEESKEEATEYDVSTYMRATQLADQVKDLNINYSEWNEMTPEQREDLVRPEIKRFADSHRNEFDKDNKLFDLVVADLQDYNFHTEAKVLVDEYRGGE